MKRHYDPDAGPDRSKWLDIPEAERIDAVGAHHRRHGVSLPRPRLHAVIHVVVENQLALGEQDVIDALDRLQAEGLSRHDAIHAIGMVLCEHLADVLEAGGEPSPELHERYFDRLQGLTADKWRRSG